MIKYNKENKTFKLDTKQTTYQFMIAHSDFLVHLYYGDYLDTDSIQYLNDEEIKSGCCYNKEIGNTFSLDSAMLEYSYFGTGDHALDSLKIKNSFGDYNTLFKYTDHKIYKGRKKLPNLPYAEETNNVMTLEVTLTDDVTSLMLKMYYVVYEDLDVIIRYNQLVNRSLEEVTVEKFSSLTLDLPSNDFDVISLNGRYALERQISRDSLNKGVMSIESRKGISSHQTNPFVSILSPETTNDYGDAYGIILSYSGDFKIQIERNQYDNARINTLINDETTKFLLEPNETLYTPETIITYSNQGINLMSQNLHAFIRKTYLNQNFIDKKRPVVVNTWEGNFFNINEAELLKYAQNAKVIGADLLVVDDGWFHNRNNDKAGLGDWFYDKEKFPNGIAIVADKVREMGLDFGIWMEPEMVNENSQLFKKNPHWVLSNSSRILSHSRNQLVLDLTNPEVVDHLYAAISNVIDETKASYIKLDMNRPLCEVGSHFLPKKRQLETSYRYMLGVYNLYGRLTDSYPDLLIESCASGGGRFDLGMLKYSTQIWTSDNTSPYERLNIQRGTLLAYPMCSISNHVTAGFNGGSMRKTSLDYRQGIANLGVLGYELNLTLLSKEELSNLKENITKYKEIQDIILYGKVYNLTKITNDNFFATNIVSSDERLVYLTTTQSRGSCNRKKIIIKLKGLDKNATYSDKKTNKTYTGLALMNAGFVLNDFNGDDIIKEFIFEKM